MPSAYLLIRRTVLWHYASLNSCVISGEEVKLSRIWWPKQAAHSLCVYYRHWLVKNSAECVLQTEHFVSSYFLFPHLTIHASWSLVKVLFFFCLFARSGWLLTWPVFKTHCIAANATWGCILLMSTKWTCPFRLLLKCWLTVAPRCRRYAVQPSQS